MTMANGTLQQTLFQHIKSNLPSHLSLVDELATLLNISNDSAYRRLRAEKPLTLEEVQKIASHYKISLDHFLHLESDSYIFSGQLIEANDTGYQKWLDNVLRNMQFVNSFQERKVIFFPKDLPFFDHFQVKELAAFKHFFWRKSILHFPSMRGEKFSVDDNDPAHTSLCNKIIEVYNQIPSTEIWNEGCINSTIGQIEFCRASKLFRDNQDIRILYQKLEELVDHLEMQAELGVKFLINEKPKENAGSHVLLTNEIILGDSTFHAVLDGKRITYLNHSTLNYVMTRDERFTLFMQEVLDNLIRKSTQISMTGQKERSFFFNRLRERIQASSTI